MKKIKIGIVGTGKWGKNLLKEFNEQAEVVMVCHKGSAESDKFLNQNYPNIKSATLLEDVLNDPSIEAVAVATPTQTHFEIALQVLMADKHLFLEKPGTSSSNELEKLCKEAEKQKSVFAVGYEFVHHPVLKKIKELLITTELRGIYFEWSKWGSFGNPVISNLISHDISVIKALGIDSLNLKNYFEQKVISDGDITRLEFEASNNILITSYINRVSNNKNKSITFVGNEKSYLWDNNDLFEIDYKKQMTGPISISNISSVSQEITDFLNSIEEKRTPLTDGKFALEIWRIMERIKN